MKKAIKSWRSFLTESEMPTHNRYEAVLDLSIDQDKSIDRTEIMNEIRAIPAVTTVYREEEVSTSTRLFVGKYVIRFILPPTDDPVRYYSRELKPQLNSILGLGIQTDHKFTKVGEF